MCFHVVRNAVNGRFAGIVDIGLVIGKHNRAYVRSKESGKEVVPAGEPVIWSAWIADEGLGKIWDVYTGNRTEPPTVRGSEHVA
jgi:hypothetical protein